MKKKTHWKERAQSAEDMRDHYKEMTDTAVGEIQFERCQVDELLDVLTAIEDMGDPVISMVCKNAKDKHYTNRLVHTRKLFPISYR